MNTVPAVRVTATARIRASREQVWAVLTDFSTMHRWFAGLRAVRLEGPPEVGATRLVTFMGGLTHRETVTAWKPPSRLALVAEEASGLIASGATVDIRLEEDHDARAAGSAGRAGTAGGARTSGAQGSMRVRLDWAIEHRLEMGRVLAALTRPLDRGLVGVALRLSLARLKRRAESASRS
ncbi:MAG TPA: SRPBCC family protein [bacterium]|nr:SRPBCC family protein [bacterium]